MKQDHQVTLTRPEHKFQLNEKVIIDGEKMTVLEINWLESSRRYMYISKQYPYTFFYENELAKEN